MEHVKKAKAALVELEQKVDDEASVAKITAVIGEHLKEIKTIFQSEDSKPDKVEAMYNGLIKEDLIPLLLNNMKKLEFESKRDASSVFTYLMRKPENNTAVAYIHDHPELLQRLVEGYNDVDLALVFGPILRECARHESLCAAVLNSTYFYEFFEYVQKPSFDVASDAFLTLKIVLTKHKSVVQAFLTKNYVEFFGKYNDLIQSKNYVTMRQSLKLLGEILLDRSNFNVMMKFISDAENLKLLMILLRHKSKNIEFEAFHIFKVFVANPEKPKAVLDILVRNKAKLIEFLQNFATDNEDPAFQDEKNILLATLSRLEAPDESKDK